MAGAIERLVNDAVLKATAGKHEFEQVQIGELRRILKETLVGLIDTPVSRFVDCVTDAKDKG